MTKTRAVGPQSPPLESNRTTERTENHEPVDRSCIPGNRRSSSSSCASTPSRCTAVRKNGTDHGTPCRMQGRRIVEFSETARARERGVGTLSCAVSNTTRNQASDTMTLNSMQYIPLASAYLCPNCGCVGNCSERCPACASTALLGLASILDREYEEATQPEFQFCFSGCDPIFPHQFASSGSVLAE